MSIARPVMLHSQIQPNRLAMADPASVLENMTYGELAELSRSLRAHLQSRGVMPGERVAVSFKDRILLVLTILAMSEIGVDTVVILQSQDPASEIDRLITDRPISDGAKHTHIQIGPQAFSGTASFTEMPPGAASAGTRIVLPTIATPVAQDQGILTLDYQGIASRIADRAQARGGIEPAAWLGAGDPRSEAGFLFVLECLWHGRSIVLSSSQFDEDIQVIELYQATALNILASDAASYFAALKSKRGLSSELRAAVISGTRFDPGLMDAIKARVSANIRLVLDSAATGPFAVATYLGASLPSRYSVLPGVEVSLRQPERGAGAVWVRPKGGTDSNGGDVAWQPTGLSGSLMPNGMLVPVPQ